MGNTTMDVSPEFKEALERYKNLQLPPCPKCASLRTAIVRCGMTGISIYIASNTPKLLLRPGGTLGKYYCRECKNYFND